MRNAVLVVHGISRHQRYEIQSAFASGLQAQLQNESPLDRQFRLGTNAPPGRGTWSTGLVWPLTYASGNLEEPQAFALRVDCRDANGQPIPEEPVVDVFEGYWSPIDKEQTGPFRVLSWLLKSTFVPLSDVRTPGNALKNAFDMAYTALALMAALAALIFVFSSAIRAYHAYTAYAAFDLRGLVLAAIGAYFLAQVAARLWPVITLRGKLTLWSGLFLLLFGIAGLLLLVVPTQSPTLGAVLSGISGPRGWLLASAFALRFVLSFAKDFLVDSVGDIQIYTTQDENARFFQFREQIIATVGTALLRILGSKNPDGSPTYDKVFLVGHSLGTTVLMDVILSVHELVEAQTLDVESWRRIRGFVTFGTALEKTRFFFDVRNQHLSPAVLQWRRDVYGHIFTDNVTAIDGPAPQPDANPNGIFWANYWYFTDVVANEIVTYHSQRGPGEDLSAPTKAADHPLCINTRLPTRATLWPHSNYLSDPAFWHSNGQLGVLSIVAHG